MMETCVTDKERILEKKSDDPNVETRSTEEEIINESPEVAQLRKWLNKTLKIEMSDGRVLIGVFLCTDRDANIILGSCSEYLPDDLNLEQPSTSNSVEEPRMLGLVMVPGKHIVSICIDENESVLEGSAEQPSSSEISTEDVM
ncbi:hypothetical protein FQA39_LY10412 [Lamprigera yunnana]|nr:hypothetical protein FQA39_LY10412 [Lamprigera yunnana]